MKGDLFRTSLIVNLLFIAGRNLYQDSGPTEESFTLGALRMMAAVFSTLLGQGK